MSRKSTNNVGRRAWNLLRLAIIWARKGGVFKRRLFLIDFRLVPKFIKTTLGHSTSRGQLHYGDHELSFDETPLFHVKMHRCHAPMRFHFPCITTTPQVDFDYEFDVGDDDDDSSDVCSYEGERRSSGYDGGEEREDEEDDGIDLRAEKFIAEFYDRIKMQRQIYFSHEIIKERGS